MCLLAWQFTLASAWAPCPTLFKCLLPGWCACSCFAAGALLARPSHTRVPPSVPPVLCSVLSEVSEGTFLFDRNPISQDEFSTGERHGASCNEGQGQQGTHAARSGV